MLRLGDDLVWHIFNIAFNCYVAGLPCDFVTICSGGSRAVLSVRILLLLEGFECDNRADGRVVTEPWVITDLFKAHSLLGVRFEQL